MAANRPGALPALPGLEFEAACVHSMLASLAGQPGSGVSVVEGEKEAERAIKSLGRAVAKGYQNANELRYESAFNSLRERDDFKKLFAKLGQNLPAEPKK